MTLQEQIDALSNDAAWHGGWYQPIEFPDGSRTHSTKRTDAEFYDMDSLGQRKWDRVIAPFIPCSLHGSKFLEIGCNAGLNLVLAHRAGATVFGVENHPQFVKQARLVLGTMCPEATLIEHDAEGYDFKDGPFSVVLMANLLYWLGRGGEDVAGFVERAAKACRYVVAVGAECSMPYASVGTASKLLGQSFDLEMSSIVQVRDRTLNVVVGRSRLAMTDTENLLGLLRKREQPECDAATFIDTYSQFVKEVLGGKLESGGYRQWIQGVIAARGRCSGCKEERDIDARLAFDRGLIRDVQQHGVKRPIATWADERGLDIDGWHRLVIASVCGFPNVPFMARDKN